MHAVPPPLTHLVLALFSHFTYRFSVCFVQVAQIVFGQFRWTQFPSSVMRRADVDASQLPSVCMLNARTMWHANPLLSIDMTWVQQFLPFSVRLRSNSLCCCHPVDMCMFALCSLFVEHSPTLRATRQWSNYVYYNWDVLLKLPVCKHKSMAWFTHAENGFWRYEKMFDPNVFCSQ